jgi:Asp-tRNA(Asn)/Glu-tRNA(Gln) amidotransferase A subunit family amidase
MHAPRDIEPFRLTATAAAKKIITRELTCEELTRSLTGRIAERDATVRAWASMDPDRSIARARELDKILIDRGPLGPLHGLPFGFKDIVDTRDYPTTYNSPPYANNQPSHDASCVRVVKACGGLVLGKTDTVEFAAGGRKALTRNPHDPTRTPGGSSSGSGAAVGDFQVPLAFGTQTGGSHIRPASFNGIYAIKPTHNVVAWAGTMGAVPVLDTLGWYGRCPEDLTLVARAFRLRDLDATAPVALKGLKVGYARTYNWPKTEASARDAMDKAAKRLSDAGATVFDLELDAKFSSLNDVQKTLAQGEGQVHFLPEYLERKEHLHGDFINKVENTRGVSAADLVKAYDHAALCRIAFDALFGETLDVVLTPAAPGEAPVGLETTGDWVFNSMWTVLHTPCVAIPVHKGPNGCPVGIQIVGPRFGDARLLAIAEVAGPVIDCA